MIHPNQQHELPDLSVLMDHTPHDLDSSVPEKKSAHVSPILVGSVALLFLFSLVSVGAVVYQNQQAQSTEIRSQAAELGDLMNSTQPQVCQNVKFYKNGQEVTTSSLMPGDTVQIAIPSGQSSKASFSINQATAVETQTKNNAGEFVYQYTFPQSMTNVTVRATLFP